MRKYDAAIKILTEAVKGEKMKAGIGGSGSLAESYCNEKADEIQAAIDLLVADEQSTKPYTDTRKSLYDDICAILTDAEGYGGRKPAKKDFYDLLVRIQMRWEDTITACESCHVIQPMSKALIGHGDVRNEEVSS